MFICFDSLFVLYWVLALSGVPVLILTADTLSLPERILLFAGCIIWIFIVAIVLSLIAQKRVERIDKVRTERCQVREALAAYEQIAAKKRVMRNKTVRRAVLVGLSAQYITLGDTARAAWLLGQIDIPPVKNATTAITAAAYCNNYYCVFLQENNIDRAEQALSDLKRILDSPKMADIYKSKLLPLYQGKVLALKLAKGEFEGLDVAVELLMQNADNLLTKVSDHKMLAEIYHRTGRDAQARDSLRFILENGGDTYYVGWAQAYLASMNPPTANDNIRNENGNFEN